MIVARHSRDILREALLRVVLRPVADDLACVGDAPEGAGVVRDTIEDLEWDTVLVGNIGRLDRLAEKLLQVALADVAGDVADIALARSRQFNLWPGSRFLGRANGPGIAWGGTALAYGVGDAIFQRFAGDDSAEFGA